MDKLNALRALLARPVNLNLTIGDVVCILGIVVAIDLRLALHSHQLRQLHDELEDQQRSAGLTDLRTRGAIVVLSERIDTLRQAAHG